MGRKRKSHSQEFKAEMALEAVKGVHTLRRWRRATRSIDTDSTVEEAIAGERAALL